MNCRTRIERSCRALTNNLLSFVRLTLLSTGLLTSFVMAQPVREYPPSLPPTVAINGGRVRSIAVSPTDRRRVIAAHLFGGLWQTTNGGRNWYHLDGLQAVFVVDVVYAADGQTVIATVARDLKTVNGGGIWISRNEGETWEQPRDGSGAVPTTTSGLMRTSAWGISYAPDNRNKVYVGTDYGIAISNNNGESWTHRLLERTGPAAFAVQGLPGNRAIAVTRSAIYFKDPDDVWRVIRRGWFAAGAQYVSDGFKLVDVSPYDSDKVFILQDYNTLLLYEVTADSWTQIPLPGGGSRGPFVRAARGLTGSQSIDLWVGVGAALYRVSCADLACFRRIRCVRRTFPLPPEPCDWQQISEGLHADCGDLGLDNQKRPVMIGNDGGLFKPRNSAGTSWELASPGGTEMNSYQMTSLAGTNYGSNVRIAPSLYFATQDNGLWASPDGGLTWPHADWAEGWHMQTWNHARSTTDPAARVAYSTIGGAHGGPRISDANLLNQRDANPRPIRIPGASGESFTLYDSFLLSPNNWMRFQDGRFFFIDRRVGSWHISLSTDNLERWRDVGTTVLNPNSSVFRSGGPLATRTAYATFDGALLDSNGNPRIALARMDDVLHVSPGEITESNLLYLPPNGTLGVRATEFDWHPIYGVDPSDPDFLIAPDINNGMIWYSTRRDSDGRPVWASDDELTDRVTQLDTTTGQRRLMFYEGNPGQVQVTEIAFSPYERNLIMVGTREAGVFYSENRGEDWQQVPGSEGILYVTGFFFRPNGTVYASTYGRGLWKIDMWWRWREFHVFPICGFNYGDCIIRLPPDPRRNVIKDFSWSEYNVLVVFDGRITGLLRSGDQVKSITVTPNASYRLYTVKKQALPEITESKEGAGFPNDLTAEVALENQEVITAVIFKGNEPVGYLTNKEEFKTNQAPLPRKPGKEVSGDKPGVGLPYLSVMTKSQLGPGLVQVGGVVYLFGSGFLKGNTAEVTLDGATRDQVKVQNDGRLAYTLQVGERLSLGQHRLEVRQKTNDGERKAVASFIMVRGADHRTRQR